MGNPTEATIAPDLRTRLIQALADPGAVLGDVRGAIEPMPVWQARAAEQVLTEDGWIVPGVPGVRQVLADAQQSSDALVLTKLVIRFFRVMILGAVVIPETPAAMDWLRDYIDGTHKVHGPLGKPMIWPGRLNSICQLLREWGFQPTPTNPQYVSLKPGGMMAPLTMADPAAPDPRSVVPMDELRDAKAAQLGKLLDTFTDGVRCMALDRTTVLRAMAAAYDSGRYGLTMHVAQAAQQLRDHQQQASEDGSMVTVSRQALDQVINHLAVDGDEGLPDGLFRVDGKVMFTCQGCGQAAELPIEPHEYEPGMDYCGGSPRCCP